MTELGQQFISNSVQCWSCPLFDRMFQIVSDAAAALYDKFTGVCVALFLIIFAFYIFGAVWTNLTKGFQDSWFDKSLRPVFINSIFVLAFLGMGVMLPRFITTITFEPVAYVTQTYSAAMLNTNPDAISEHVNYTPITINQDGFFRQELKDTTINIAKVTITQFQSFMKLGVAMVDAGLSWSAFFGIGALVKHFILTIMGAYLLWAFFKMFFVFMCYFVDVIMAMTMFAFFFPLSVVMAAFKDASDVPSWLSWIKNIGKGVGIEQIKNLVSSIIALGSAVITYTVILVIIARFFANPEDGTDSFQTLLTSVMDGTIYDYDLDKTVMNDLSFVSIIVLVYVLTFIYDNIPQVKKMILDMFEVSDKTENVGEKLGKELFSTSQKYIGKVGDFGKKAIKKISGKA